MEILIALVGISFALVVAYCAGHWQGYGRGVLDQQEFTRAVSRGDKKPQDWQEEGW